jgi:hypothetical protein
MRPASLTTSLLGIALVWMWGCASHGPVSTAAHPPSDTQLSTNGDDPCLKQPAFEYPDAGAGQPAPTESGIHLLSISPQPGSALSEQTALLADLEYSVAGFEPGQFKILAQFDTDTRGLTTDGSFKNYAFPKFAVGKLRFCFPLRHVWNLPNIKRPLTVRFMLNRVYESGLSVPVAKTATLIFPSTGQTDVTTPPADSMPSDEYAAALTHVYSAFQQYAADRRYCADHFPEFAPAINASFERWTTTYSGVNKEVTDLFVKWVATRVGGDQRRTHQMVNDYGQVAMQTAARGTREQLNNRCGLFSRFLDGRNSDPEVTFSSQLAAIRSQENPASPHR